MTEKETAAETKNAIFAVILIILIIAALIYLFPKVILPWLKGLGGEKMTPETKSEVLNNFDKLIDNLDICDSMNDENCFCEVFPAFPTVFHSNIILKIDDNLGQLTLYDKKTEIKKLEEEPFFKIRSLEYGQDSLILHDENLPTIFNIGFAEKVPKIQEIMRGYVVSNYALKEFEEIHILTFYNKAVKDKPNIIEQRFIGSKNIPTDANLEEIKKIVEKMPKCQEGRIEAIDFLNKIDSIVGDKLIEINEAFVIKFNSLEIWLESDGNKVFNIRESSSGSNPVFSSEEAKKTITLCLDSKQEGEIKADAVIKIKEENGKNCLFI